jgi:hypothetical protein
MYKVENWNQLQYTLEVLLPFNLQNVNFAKWLDKAKHKNMFVCCSSPEKAKFG